MTITNMNKNCYSGSITTKTKAKAKKVKQSIKFSNQVSVRIIAPNMDQHATRDLLASTWYSKGELKESKSVARTSAKLHHLLCNVINNNNNNCEKMKFHPANFELGGESLRGMEHLTDLETGRLRKKTKDLVIASVVAGQSIKKASADEELCDALSRAAVSYSLRMAEEDAKMAAEILKEDMQSPVKPVAFSGQNTARHIIVDSRMPSLHESGFCKADYKNMQPKSHLLIANRKQGLLFTGLGRVPGEFSSEYTTAN